MDFLQTLYQLAWDGFVKWCGDNSRKVCSDEKLGSEYGDRLRVLISTHRDRACLKSAFAEGWRASLAARDTLASDCHIMADYIRASDLADHFNNVASDHERDGNHEYAEEYGNLSKASCRKMAELRPAVAPALERYPPRAAEISKLSDPPIDRG